MRHQRDPEGLAIRRESSLNEGDGFPDRNPPMVRSAILYPRYVYTLNPTPSTFVTPEIRHFVRASLSLSGYSHHRIIVVQYYNGRHDIRRLVIELLSSIFLSRFLEKFLC